MVCALVFIPFSYHFVDDDYCEDSASESDEITIYETSVNTDVSLRDYFSLLSDKKLDCRFVCIIE